MSHLRAQDVVIELCSDGLSAGILPNALAKLLKSVGYNRLSTSAHGARSSEANRYGMCR
jgi:hypothetical protein